MPISGKPEIGAPCPRAVGTLRFAHPTASECSVEQQSLKGKIAIVTGGSSGIGAAAGRLFAAEGASVYVGYNMGLDRAEKLIGELPGSGHKPVRIVLEDSATIRAAAKTVGDA